MAAAGLDSAILTPWKNWAHTPEGLLVFQGLTRKPLGEDKNTFYTLSLRFKIKAVDIWSRLIDFSV